MELKDILAELDGEISRLQQARALLSGETEKKPVTTRKKRVAKVVVEKPEAKKRKLTPEGRKRIAEAMKRRWAERKKQAVPKPAKS